MQTQQIIKCAFCQGTGSNPHFKGTCPVCKGRGKNEVSGKYMPCSSCRGSGQKGGTTLTCYDCEGLGIVPDTRETFIRAREEIKEAQEEMARERPARRLGLRSHFGEGGSLGGSGEELTERPVVRTTPKSKKHLAKPDLASQDKLLKRKGEEDGKTHFCQCCASEVNNSIQIKICPDCFGKMKEIA